MATTLVTGAAGFIGFHVSRRLLERGERVVGLDNLNDYYSVDLKRNRWDQLRASDGFEAVELDIVDQTAVGRLFAEHQPEFVIHLAAQPGVRYSLENPRAYVDCNLVGFLSILEGCRHEPPRHLVYASSSSVYGANRQQPFSVSHNVDHPVSLYAATKKANELMAHTYSHLYRLPTTGLRFFTVYGPWGRPDMAAYKFTDAILAGRPIDVYNHGKMRRDFTYIDDIVEGVLRVAAHIPTGRDGSVRDESVGGDKTAAPYRVYNIGNNQPVELLQFIETLEKCLGQTAQKNLLPLQPGDVVETYADIDDLARDVGFQPSTPIDVGLRHFVDWYLDYSLGAA